MSEPAPAQVEAPVPQDSATSVAAEPAAEGGAEGQSKKGAKKVRARSVNLEALIVTRGIGARSRAARAPRDPAIVPRDSSRSRRAHARRVPTIARTHSCPRARPPARRRIRELLATETKKFRHLPISADSDEQPEPRR